MESGINTDNFKLSLSLRNLSIPHIHSDYIHLNCHHFKRFSDQYTDGVFGIMSGLAELTQQTELGKNCELFEMGSDVSVRSGDYCEIRRVDDIWVFFKCFLC